MIDKRIIFEEKYDSEEYGTRTLYFIAPKEMLNGKYPEANYSTFCLMMQDLWGDFKEIKVIGNIIDNPELVGGNYEYK